MKIHLCLRLNDIEWHRIHCKCICVYRVVFGPEKMVTVPPRHYCVIENPVLRNDKGDIVNDKSGQAKLQHADQEIRCVH